MTYLSTLSLAAVLIAPPGDPIVPCPPCAYTVSTKTLTGKLDAMFQAPFPFKELVVTLKTSDGALHPYPVATPSAFNAGQTFTIQIPDAVTSNVVLVQAAWKDKDGNPVTQDTIGFTQ
jgi:hypothetical protein